MTLINFPFFLPGFEVNEVCKAEDRHTIGLGMVLLLDFGFDKLIIPV
jgi:hypothetical protein